MNNLKSTIENKLKSANVEYKFILLPKDLPDDLPSHMVFHGGELKQAIPSIVYWTEKGIIAAQRRGDMVIDEEKLKQLAGVKELKFASKEDLDSLGVESGAVPLTGLPIPYYTDSKVLEIEKIYTGCGREFAVTLSSKDLVKLNNSKVGNFSRVQENILSGKRHRILSGITPSGDGTLHIGNYLGAVRQFKTLARNHECFLMVADLHALTTIQNRKLLSSNIENLILNELALLGDLTNIIFFRQSDVLQHTELTWVLDNVTPLGLLKRAHAYKDKLAKDVMEDDINLGLFNYPILMAADILLYQADLVPVGKDQKQHVEICRDIGERFNKIYGRKTFTIPDPYIPEEVAVVLGTDGKRKMSKSLGNLISIFESEEVIRKQVMGTYTDPTRAHATDPGHIEGNMVFSYLDFFGGKKEVHELKNRYKEGKVSDVAVKEYLFESLMKTFKDARVRYQELKTDKKKVQDILKKGSAKAREVAGKTMTEVRNTVGLTNSYSFFSYPTNSSGNEITIDQFAKVVQRVGKVIQAENVKGSEKLIRLTVDFNDEKRIIFTGVRSFGYTAEFFRDKQFIFVVNLKPRKMPSFVETPAGKLNEESQGMILAVDGPSKDSGQGNKPIFVSGEGMPIGAKIR